MTSMKRAWIGLVIAGLLGVAASSQEIGGISGQLLEIAKRRLLDTDDLMAAVKTYTPAGHDDEFVCMNSGGQAASVIVYGVPSMRILKYIPTGAPDSSAGYGFDQETRDLMRQGRMETQDITWGDTHHPAFSETDGKYDGRYLFINDKANPRVFVIDLRDFETKQIVPNPIFRADHGGAFVTPNTEYIIEGSQYPAPPDRSYHPLTQANFNKYWRGGITFHKFDGKKGRIDPRQSFTVLAPPYTQDISDAGKGESFGYSFTNSFCSERYIGGIEKGRLPFEAGCSAKDMDYLHVVNWKKAEALVKQGKASKINNHFVISLEQAAKEGVLFLIPEPKSPHGADVSPDGRYIIVAGKLDTHATVYDFRKIKELMEKGDFAERDPYGVPILDFQKSIHGQVEIGLGPLHTQFDAQTGIAYTSVYIDSVVAKWNYLDLKVLDKVSVNYNIGHLVAMQGDSRDPRGKYVIALNKLAIDRFNPVGPLHPQNHQLIDVSGDKMRLLYDLPLPMGEPHYTVCIDAKAIHPIDVYPVGTDSTTMERSKFFTPSGRERVVRAGGKVEIFATASQKGFQPEQVDVTQGEQVEFHITNLETEADKSFNFVVGGMNAMSTLPPGRTATVKFVASQPGLFNYQSIAMDDPFENRLFGRMFVKPSAAFEKRRLQQIQNIRAEQAKLAPVAKASAVQTDLKLGQKEFQLYGCIGCHQQGKDVSAPDLTNVTARRQLTWLKEWIATPEKFFDDPSVAPLIARYAIKMPNQSVPPEDIDKIIEYLKTWTSAPAAAAGSAGGGVGEQRYRKTCFACHDQGVAGAPKVGDKDAWAPRIAQGKETLFSHALNGFQGKSGFMPPKGACADCSDDEIKRTVEFIMEKAK
jgi:nitrous-oxide reductase